MQPVATQVYVRPRCIVCGVELDPTVEDLAVTPTMCWEDVLSAAQL